MDKVKIDNFGQEFPGQQFPPFSTLGRSECETLRRRACQSLGVDEQTSGEDLVRHLNSRENREVGMVSDQGEAPLSSILKDSGMTEGLHVFLNWHWFEDVDRMALDDLESHFSDIWYPAADDLELFDETCRWFLCVSHFGQITLIDLR